MPQPVADRNLLFGVLAMQMDFITREQLIAAMQGWVFDKAKPLGAILHAQKALAETTTASCSKHSTRAKTFGKAQQRRGEEPGGGQLGGIGQEGSRPGADSGRAHPAPMPAARRRSSRPRRAPPRARAGPGAEAVPMPTRAVPPLHP